MLYCHLQSGDELPSPFPMEQKHSGPTESIVSFNDIAQVPVPQETGWVWHHKIMGIAICILVIFLAVKNVVQYM